MLKAVSSLQDWSLLILRVIVAAAFLVHGAMKWGLWTADAMAMSDTMLLIFKILSILEPLAGIALILGIFTPVAAAMLGVIMLGAMFMKIDVMQVAYSVQQGTGWEFDLTLLGANFVLLAFGAGKFSLDQSMGKNV
ncbi:DoxX family protein [Candidatus Peregrinibacteria bacterium]|nr:DoxX family protein [Candidatus Peregrinibacteria bacterium]MBI3816445.1 DoxX family protein [Candidatus Peregrinibacteria bacterium]